MASMRGAPPSAKHMCARAACTGLAQTGVTVDKDVRNGARIMMGVCVSLITIQSASRVLRAGGTPTGRSCGRVP